MRVLWGAEGKDVRGMFVRGMGKGKLQPQMGTDELGWGREL
jgi:hypothetical protein